MPVAVLLRTDSPVLVEVGGSFGLVSILTPLGVRLQHAGLTV